MWAALAAAAKRPGAAREGVVCRLLAVSRALAAFLGLGLTRTASLPVWRLQAFPVPERGRPAEVPA